MKLKNRLFLILLAVGFLPFAAVSYVSLELAFQSIDMVTSPGIGRAFSLSDSLTDVSLKELAASCRSGAQKSGTLISFDEVFVIAYGDTSGLLVDSGADTSLVTDHLQGIAASPDSAGYLIAPNSTFIWAKVAYGDSTYIAARTVSENLARLIDETADNLRQFDQFMLLSDINKNYFRIIWGLSIAGYLILILVVSRVLARGLTRPLTLLGSMADRIGEGNWDVRLPYSKKDEIGTLVDGFNRMSTRLTETTNRLVQAEKTAAWESTARVIAHGIKNVLAPVKLAVSRLSKLPLESNSEMTSSVETIRSEIDSLERTANDFSQFGKSRRSEPVVSDINMLIRQSLRLCEDVMKNVTIKSDLDASSPRALIDEAMVRDAVINLVRNACEAAPTGSEVSIRTAADHNQVTIVISNDAHDFNHDTAERMFEPYYTTKPSGTGLGLAIAKKCVESSGGRLTWDFAEGKIRFNVTFESASND